MVVELAQRIPVSHFPLRTKCTFLPFKQPMVALVLSMQLLQLTLKALRGTLEGTNCFKVCNRLQTTAVAVAVWFYFVLQTRQLCLLLDRETHRCLYLVLIL